MSDDNLPDRPQRLVGLSPDGIPVNNVTRDNRWDTDPRHPTRQIALMDEDCTRILKMVTIRATREFPDIVMHHGEAFIVENTRLNPPQYRQCMVLETHPEAD